MHLLHLSGRVVQHCSRAISARCPPHDQYLRIYRPGPWDQPSSHDLYKWQKGSETVKNTKIIKIFLTILIVFGMISSLVEGILPEGILPVVRIIQYASGVVLLSSIWTLWKDVPPVVVFSFGYNDDDDENEDADDDA